MKKMDYTSRSMYNHIISESDEKNRYCHGGLEKFGAVKKNLRSKSYEQLKECYRLFINHK